MNKDDLCTFFEDYDFRPSRKLGQNFLLDKNLLSAMIRDSAPQKDENILEIGPGTGILTDKLLQAEAKVTAIEIDHRLAEWLQERFAEYKNFTLVRGDACQLDYKDIFGNEKYRCIANLPYSCSSVFLAKINFQENPPQEMFVLLQKEMAERLLARTDDKKYGLLTAKLAWRYDIRLLRNVPKEVFFPQPEVESSYLKLTLKKTDVNLLHLQSASKVAACAFSQRRKIAFNLLKSNFCETKLAEAFDKLNLSRKARAENISPEQYLQLAELIMENQ